MRTTSAALPQPTTHLTVWALPQRRVFLLLRDIAESVELYDMFVVLVDGEADLSNGAYIDAAMV